jgi:C1A family cysteine protease
MRYVVSLGVTLILFAGGFTSAFAQLSDNDIRALQDRGKAEGWTFTVTKNPATQYSLDQLTGFKVPDNWRELAPFENKAVTRMLPSSYDWRVQVGGLPPIRNQLSCGSCWAFATVGALECNIKVKDNTNVDLSEQWLISCNQNNYSCAGGWWCHHYFLNSPDRCGGTGAVLESEFPYQYSNGTCSSGIRHVWSR